MQTMRGHNLLLVILVLTGMFLGERLVKAERMGILASCCDFAPSQGSFDRFCQISAHELPDSPHALHEAAFVEELNENTEETDGVDGDPQEQGSTFSQSFRGYDAYLESFNRSIRDGRLYYMFARRAILFRALLI
jgi:hypothetical protein